jgi:long-chain acyl-CoA synthetase
MLDERSNRLAQALLAAGRPGSRIAHLDRSAPEIVELLFATSKIGAVTVPLNWRLAVPELRAVLEDARAPLVIAGPDYEETVAEVVASISGPPQVVGVRRGHEPVSGPRRRSTGRRRVRRRRAAALHRHDGRAEGRAHHPPTWAARDVAVLAVRRQHRLLTLPPMSPHRRDRLDVSVSERRHDDPRARVRPDVVSTSSSTSASRTGSRADHAADADSRCGRRAARLPALRSIAYGASPITTPVLTAALRTFHCSLYGSTA